MMICDLWWSATPCRSMVWALPLSLAATQGIDVSFSSSGYLDVSVHRVTSCMAIYSPYGTYTLLYVGSPIRKSADQWLFAPPRSLSQLVTSFVGSCCQGIRLMLLLAWSYACLLPTLLRCCSVDPMLTYSGMLRFVSLRAPCTANKILRIYLYLPIYKSLSW